MRKDLIAIYCLGYILQAYKLEDLAPDNIGTLHCKRLTSVCIIYITRTIDTNCS